ncbi:MCE family protein [candidate division KSB1 bacterium]|nr:MCE family protein [candidate division KSB1 bacterium]
MDYRASELKAGIFIALSAIVFIAFLVIIIGFSSIEEKDIYRARFQFVGGIEEGTLVRYAGLLVGRVIDLAIPTDGDPRIEVFLQVEKGTPIRQDSRAYVTSIGLMGAYYIEISAGSPSTPPLPSGSLINSNDVAGFGQLSGSFDSVAEELSRSLENINLFLNEKNRDNISGMLRSMNGIMQTTEQNMDLIFANLNHLSSKMDSSMTILNRFIVQNDTSVSNSLKSLESILDQTKESVSTINVVLKDVDRTFLSNGTAYNEVVYNLLKITHDLEEFTQEIKERPWMLVRKDYQPVRKLPEK